MSSNQSQLPVVVGANPLPKPTPSDTHNPQLGSPTKNNRFSHEDIQSLIAIAKENGLHPYLNQGGSKGKRELGKLGKEERMEWVNAGGGGSKVVEGKGQAAG